MDKNCSHRQLRELKSSCTWTTCWLEPLLSAGGRCLFGSALLFFPGAQEYPVDVPANYVSATEMWHPSPRVSFNCSSFLIGGYQSSKVEWLLFRSKCPYQSFSVCFQIKKNPNKQNKTTKKTPKNKTTTTNKKTQSKTDKILPKTHEKTDQKTKQNPKQNYKLYNCTYNVMNAISNIAQPIFLLKLFLFKCSISLSLAVSHWWRGENGDYTPDLGSCRECNMDVKKQNKTVCSAAVLPASNFQWLPWKVFE